MANVTALDEWTMKPVDIHEPLKLDGRDFRAFLVLCGRTAGIAFRQDA